MAAPADPEAGWPPADADHAALAAFLAAPPLRVAPARLAEAWSWTQIDALVGLPDGYSWFPELPDRVRGAWGRALMASASEEARRERDPMPCPWRPPCALHGLWALGGENLPRPYAVTVDEAPGARDRVVVSARLYGIAQRWAGEAADALVRALEGGVAHRTGAARARLPVLAHEIVRVPGVVVPPAPRRAILEFVTPLRLRIGGKPVLTPDGALAALVKRVEAAARWQGRALDADMAALERRAGAIRLAGALDRVEWLHASGARDGGLQRWETLIGDLALEGEGADDLAPFMPFLTIGAVLHVGGSAAMGLGRYRLRPDDGA